MSDMTKSSIAEIDSQSRKIRPPHPVNIRLYLPFLRRRYFLTIIGGSEQRGAERRASERQNHPIKTSSNIFFVVGFAVIFYAIAFFAVAIQSSIIEF
jgi:hypothetical protein